ncbi:Pentatricopeptide repeat-containing protein, partial [Drosera capensis]
MGLAKTVSVGNSLMDLYSKFGELKAARQVFDAILERDLCTWNSMISGYCQGGYFGEAYELFIKMQESGSKPNVTTWNLIISAYIRTRDEEEAMHLFQKMGKGSIIEPDTSSWNSLISAYLQIGDKNKAFRIFRKMQSLGIRLNSVTILTILDACGILVAANKDALVAFDEMMCEGHKPNRITLLSIIRAYSLEKMVKQGMLIYSSMTEDYHILPGSEHQSAVVHLLGRSGRLGEAIEFVEQMTSEPDPSIWHALLTASRVHGNVRAAIHAGDRLLELNPGDNVTRRIISQAYRISGRGSNTLEERMPLQSSSMLCGSSSVEVGNMIYSFDTGHVSAPAFVSTYVWLKASLSTIVQFRFVTDVSSVKEGRCMMGKFYVTKTSRRGFDDFCATGSCHRSTGLDRSTE